MSYLVEDNAFSLEEHINNVKFLNKIELYNKYLKILISKAI